MFENIKIFYDGMNLTKYFSVDYIKGFTTNTTFFKNNSEKNYKQFYESNKTFINNRPISLQIYEENKQIMIEHARIINSFGDNLYVKIPIINSRGEYNIDVISKILSENIKVNITAVFTINQLIEIKKIKTDNNFIISIFSGRINDTCRDPVPFISYAVNLFKDDKNIEILWAGCKDILSIKNAIECGCHIITVPDSILDRFERIDKNLEDVSLETVKLFKLDSENLSIV